MFEQLIHNLIKKFKVLILTFLLFLITFSGIISFLRKNNVNKAATSPDHKDLRLRTRIYNSEADLVHICQRIGNIIPQLTNYGLNWKLIVSECQPGFDEQITLLAEVPVFFYTDDMEVKLQPGRIAGTFKVDIFSSSRVGKSDLGENKRNILNLLKVLDREFD
ncbi:hypothetical protein BH23BAC1_BH23BAC1_12460 [soil metagenome]